MNVMERIIKKEKEINEANKSAQDMKNYIKSLWKGTVREPMDPAAVDSNLDSDVNLINQKYEYSDDTEIKENFVLCDHDLVIKCHESVIVGRHQVVPAKHDLSSYGIENRYQPNPNHVRYYCVGCGKELDEKEINEAEELSCNYVIDLFGHPDSLTVGYYHFKAAIDYIRSEIIKLKEANPKVSKNEIIYKLEEDFNDKRIPEKYVRRK